MFHDNAGEQEQASQITAAGYIKILPEIVMALLLVVVTILVIVSVIFRYFLNAPLTWSEELARILFIWLAFLGAAVGVKRRTHFGISAFVESLPEKANHLVSLFSTLTVLVISGLLVISAYPNTKAAFKQYYHMLQISVGWLYIAIPISGILMVIYSAVHLIEHIKKGKAPDKSAHAEPQEHSSFHGERP